MVLGEIPAHGSCGNLHMENTANKDFACLVNVDNRIYLLDRILLYIRHISCQHPLTKVTTGSYYTVNRIVLSLDIKAQLVPCQPAVS